MHSKATEAVDATCSVARLQAANPTATLDARDVLGK